MTLLGNDSWCSWVWLMRVAESGAGEVRKEELYRHLDSGWVFLDEISGLWLNMCKLMEIMWKIKGKVLAGLGDTLKIKGNDCICLFSYWVEILLIMSLGKSLHK